MSNEKFQDKYRIKSARVTWHDYSGGTYFITVCTKNHEHLFGEIIDANVETGHAPSLQKQTIQQPAIIQLSPIGLFLAEKIKNITSHCPYAEIPLFIVMPNHWHAIVLIDSDKTLYIRRNDIGTHVETGHAPSLQRQTSIQMQTIDSFKGWLSVAVGSIKSAVTKFAHENNNDFAWQTRFHDHIIRDQNEMNRIADYIENNIETWNTDCYNKNEAVV